MADAANQIEGKRLLIVSDSHGREMDEMVTSSIRALKEVQDRLDYALDELEGRT